MKRLVLAVMLAQAMLLVAAGSGAARLSEPQAKSIAAEFAKAVGMTWGTPTRVELHKDVNAQRKQELELEFGDPTSTRRAIIGIDPARGVVSSAGDFAAVAAVNTRPTPVKLDEAAAVARARKVMEAAGLEGILPLEPPTAWLKREGRAASYYVLWRPTYRHIPYDSVAVQVNISAVDGRLISMSTGLDVVPPRSTKVTVSKESAIKSATGWAKRFDASFRPSTTKADLRIVTANSYWWHYKLGPEVTPDSRVAWVVELTGAGRQLIFWIDAADSDLLGGTQSLG
jgi:hypothetical protein